MPRGSKKHMDINDKVRMQRRLRDGPIPLMRESALQAQASRERGRPIDCDGRSRSDFLDLPVAAR